MQIEKLIESAPLISTLFFFTFFMSVAVWTMLPRNKKRIEALKEIPFREAGYDR